MIALVVLILLGIVGLGAEIEYLPYVWRNLQSVISFMPAAVSCHLIRGGCFPRAPQYSG